MNIEIAYIEPDVEFTGEYDEYCFITSDLQEYTEIDLALKDLSIRQIEYKDNYPFGHIAVWVFIDEKQTPNFSVEVGGRINVL